MTWYAAHIITYVKFSDGVQDKYPIWENVVLIDSKPEDDPYVEAERIGREAYEDEDNGSSRMTWEGRPGRWVYAGIRKLIQCQDTVPFLTERANTEFRPQHGTEVTYSQMEVDSEEALTKLVNGEPVTVLYEE